MGKFLSIRDLNGMLNMLVELIPTWNYKLNSSGSAMLVTNRINNDKV